ncbi:unnamed protein product [Arctia plantaginis]|uniref:Uncharacterized protein n=1 Tax=Arctia plantaginis TaxID=874455 RepID=A0A8S0ZUN6_ARCPL|nr:unnamed protein product [Arctia plantaginis]
MNEDSSGEELSDSEVLMRCESELKEMENDVSIKEICGDGQGRSTEKRKEREDEYSEDDFITVTRRRAKRLIRSESVEETNQRAVHRKEDANMEPAKHEVCITSLELLPKPIAIAKLLRSNNIKDILRIKYKSSYKVLIQFQTKEDAIKLVNCQEIKEKGLRCQSIQEQAICYGIVKGMDLELSEAELINILKSDVEILSVRRLKRLSLDGKWIDCETIREKSIRNIMSEKPVTYRRALQIYSEKKQKYNINMMTQETSNTYLLTEPTIAKETYSSAVSKSITHHPQISNIGEEEGELEEIVSPTQSVYKPQRKQKHKKRINQSGQKENEQGDSMEEDMNEQQKESTQFMYKIGWTKMWKQIREIYKSECKLEEKLLSILKMIGEELKKFLVKIIFGEDIWEYINYSCNG